ncbi:MAG: tetraacyldisaccharide 4'-kinase [Burkholderiaceae bacterium]|nr:tetraacyldisaccharide 4'-kinase [Burkholderiaceae bacterium]
MLFKSAPRFWEKSSFAKEPIRALIDRLISVILLPLAWLFGLMIWLKQILIDTGITQALGMHRAALVPLIIVGNIRVGGTGKTPLVIALANALFEEGYKPGIISRGYQPNGQSSLEAPQEVTQTSNPNTVGDEPVLMAQRIHQQIPIWVFPKRAQSINALLKAHPEVNIIISDDGLQHAGLVRWPARDGGRDLELVVEDERGNGNGRLLPAGPLRESSRRERDATISIGTHMQIANALATEKSFQLTPEIDSVYPLHRPNESQSFPEFLTNLVGLKLAAIAAIGNPNKFFEALSRLGMHLEHTLSLPDHAPIKNTDIANIEADCIFITEKDAVKCATIEDQRIWVVPMHLPLPNELIRWVQEVIQRPNPYQR